MALTAEAQFGVLMEANEDHNGYNCALYNSSSYPCTVVKGTKSSYTQVGVLSPGELMEFVNIYGTWILRNHTRYSTKAEVSFLIFYQQAYYNNTQRGYFCVT